jgi:hypothetical protein
MLATIPLRRVLVNPVDMGLGMTMESMRSPVWSVGSGDCLGDQIGVTFLTRDFAVGKVVSRGEKFGVVQQC